MQQGYYFDLQALHGSLERAQVSELTSFWHRAFRLDIQHVRGDHADGVHLAGLALHAHSLLSASGGACCAWQPAKAQP